MTVVEGCTYTLPIDSLGYLQDFTDTYDRRIGVDYAKIRYGVCRNDSLHQLGGGFNSGVSGIERNRNYETLDLL